MTLFEVIAICDGQLIPMAMYSDRDRAEDKAIELDSKFSDRYHVVETVEAN